jgi:uracil-xanthine permease
MARMIWKLHGATRSAADVVMPEERLSWPRTVGIGLQHLVAMFGATVLVPLLTGFPPNTTIFFSGLGTLLFLVVVKNRVPSYLGSSFAFITPVVAAMAKGGMGAALGGIFVAGLAFFLVGLFVERRGFHLIDRLMPPIVTGTVVALIGLNLAPAARDNFVKDPAIAAVTLAAILVIGVATKGFAGRLSVFLGVLVGYVVAAAMHRVDWTATANAPWFGLPDFHLPVFHLRAILLIVPVVVVLIAENTGHVKAVATMTGRDLDSMMGRAFMGDGLATMLAGLGGGSGTTTYAENIGVMAATRVYSTAAYMVAGIAAILLALCPKFGALVGSIPVGVLGGATTLLYGMIAILGARIWVEARVDFRDPINLMTAAVAMVVGAANYTLHVGDYEFNGIVLGAFGAIVLYQVLKGLSGAGGAGGTQGAGRAGGRHV